MPSNVQITVTGKSAGTVEIMPFNGTQGGDASLRYRVPQYKVVVGTRTFKAVRFGLVRRDAAIPPAARVSDAGLSKAQGATPSWVPTYSPRSFQGSSRRGAFRLYPGKGFLIHEGPGPGEFGGSLGCIEITGGEWNAFLDLIEKLGGAPCAALCTAKLVTIAVEAAPFPIATLMP